MKIAVFLKNENFEYLDDHIIQIYTFNIENNLITSIGSELVTIKNLNHILLWLLSKNIEEIYLKNPNNELKSYFEKTGITVKSIEEIKDNPLLKSFLL